MVPVTLIYLPVSTNSQMSCLHAQSDLHRVHHWANYIFLKIRTISQIYVYNPRACMVEREVSQVQAHPRL